MDAQSAGSSIVAGFLISSCATAAFVSPRSAAARSRLWKKNIRTRKAPMIPKISAYVPFGSASRSSTFEAIDGDQRHDDEHADDSKPA